MYCASYQSEEESKNRKDYVDKANEDLIEMFRIYIELDREASEDSWFRWFNNIRTFRIHKRVNKTTLVVIYLGHSSLYLGHSSLYHGHSSPISDIFYYMHNYFYNRK